MRKKRFIRLLWTKVVLFNFGSLKCINFWCHCFRMKVDSHCGSHKSACNAGTFGLQRTFCDHLGYSKNGKRGVEHTRGWRRVDLCRRQNQIEKSIYYKAEHRNKKAKTFVFLSFQKMINWIYSNGKKYYTHIWNLKFFRQNTFY